MNYEKFRFLLVPALATFSQSSLISSKREPKGYYILKKSSFIKVYENLNRYDATLRDDETGNAPTNNLHNQYTRAEGWLLRVVENDGGDSDGAFGIVDPQYGVTLATNKYPDTAKKSAVLYRDGRVKRAMNIANIQTTTSSINHGNYYNNYELISVGGGKKENNLYFRKNVDTHTFVPSTIGSILPTTTNYQTLIALADKGNGNVFLLH